MKREIKFKLEYEETVEEVEELPVAQVRFDKINDEEAEIDISIAPNKRGSGFGTKALKQSVDEIFRTTSIKVVHAYIKPENIASIHAFERAKFKFWGVSFTKGQALHYRRVKKDE